MKEEKVMMDLKRVADEMWTNKIAKGFNISDVNFELVRLYGEVSELGDAIWKKKSKDEIASEVADVFLYLLSVARMADVDDIEIAVYNKLIENSKRVYEKNENGVLDRVDDKEN